MATYREPLILTSAPGAPASSVNKTTVRPLVSGGQAAVNSVFNKLLGRDAGTEGQDQDRAPKVDHRGYYRLGKPDIGAYEFGASKYILDMVDDI